MRDKQMFENMAYIILEDYANSYSKADKDTLARYLQKTFNDHLIANGVTVNEWISVEERLPECMKWVLCACLFCDEDCETYIGTFRYDSGTEIWEERRTSEPYVKKAITHWQPLPQPPKEVE